MTRFTLALLPNGKALLTTPDSMRPEQMRQIIAIWDEWKSTQRELLVVGECDIRLIEDVDLEVPSGTEEQQAVD